MSKTRNDIDFGMAVAHARELVEAGDYAEAEASLIATLAQIESVLPNDDVLLVTTKANLACLLTDRAKYGEAERLHREVLAALPCTDADPGLARIKVTNNLAVCINAAGRTEEAYTLLRHIAPKAGIEGLLNLASFLHEQGQVAQAQSLYTEILAGADPQSDIGISAKEKFATLLAEHGNRTEREKSENLLREVVDSRCAQGGDRHPDTLRAEVALALVQHKLGKIAEASDLLAEVLACQRLVLGDDHPDTLTSINNLAMLKDAQGQSDVALSLFQEALQRRESVLGRAHPDTMVSLNNLGAFCMDKREFKQAQDLLAQAHGLAAEHLGDHAHRYIFQARLGRCLEAMAKYEEAQELLKPAFAQLRFMLGDRNRHAEAARISLQRCSEALEDVDYDVLTRVSPLVSSALH